MDPAASYIIDYRPGARLLLQFEELFENTKVWLDSEPTLAKCDVAGNVENGIGSQLMELEPVEVE